MDFLSSLRREHIPLLELMGERGRAAFEKLSAGTPVPFGYKMGFHALPSMRQLHLHVISNDFISARLKTWHHYNSFATQFFRPLESVIEQLRTTGKVEVRNTALRDLSCSYTCSLLTAMQFDAQEYKTINYMSRAPCCHCGATLDTFPALQKHLLDHFKRSTASSR
ncbi:hypothetical protein HK105_200224 [Polyrhizophydium stewartii]|uniref:Aprataxin C2HE/C2H2/C2HC zinc finger domain-containing protein n=1 Tax=Polyrhizophydium stewartii TaxID=2732419 RepID=A0ABR4NKU6_9FUNG